MCSFICYTRLLLPDGFVPDMYGNIVIFRAVTVKRYTICIGYGNDGLVLAGARYLYAP